MHRRGTQQLQPVLKDSEQATGLLLGETIGPFCYLDRVRPIRGHHDLDILVPVRGQNVMPQIT
jgi:hypothetical protein